MSYYSHQKMIRYIKKLKRVDSQSRILSLDIGRKFIGSAISCKSIYEAIPFESFMINPQYNYKQYSYALHDEFYRDLSTIFRK